MTSFVLCAAVVHRDRHLLTHALIQMCVGAHFGQSGSHSTRPHLRLRPPWPIADTLTGNASACIAGTAERSRCRGKSTQRGSRDA
jgi:hypothetical protein